MMDRFVKDMGLAFCALKLEQWLIVNYEFPRLGENSPLRVAWYDGGKRPELVAQGRVPKLAQRSFVHR